MRDRPAQTVERPDCQDVAGLQAGEQLRKTRAILAGVGCVVRHDPVGRDAEGATDSRAEASIYSYSMSKGAYIGITIKGATINVNRDANLAYWHKKTEASAALSRSATDKRITPLVAALKKLIRKAD